LRKTHIIGAVWGILGVSLILGSAILRVIPHVLDAFNVGLSAFQWIILLVWCSFMLVAEGYRGFQKLFSPRVAARTWYLVNHGKTIDLILAPLYCMGYFHATKKRIITSWSLTAGITLLIIGVRFMAQPWRGIIDSGVVLGLLYGLIWVYVFTIRTFMSHTYLSDPEVAPSQDIAID
jgi:hypothetical protein